MNAPEDALWRPVPGYERYYEASTNGEIRSIRRIVNAGNDRTRIAASRLLKPTATRTGRLTVNLSRQGVVRSHLVHRLVALTFLGPGADGLEVCHNDGDCANNSVGNLRWDTHQANTLDAIKHGANPNTRKTRCPKGHPYSEPNLIVTKRGRRECRTCRRESQARYNQKRDERGKAA
ncbi:MAG: NUMOD4 motif-containing HNH endonuclease [Mycobacteriaceae bacterium]